MSQAPIVKRYGNTWDMVWRDLELAMQFDRVRDKGDDVTCMVTIESNRPSIKGRILGPQRLNLLSATGQQALAKALAERIPELRATAFGLVTSACATVVEQHMAPSPTVYMDEPMDLSPLEYTAPMMPMGETIIGYGDSESAKSLMSQQIALCVQAGVCLPWSRQPIKQANVLICDWETNQRTVYMRLQRLAAGLPEPMKAPRIAYRGMLWRRDVPPLRMLEDELPALREQIIRDNIGLVIIDSIGFAVRGKLVDDDVARQAIIDLRQLAPATRLVVAHVSKESARAERGRVDPFGSAFFRAGVRSAFEVRRAQEDVQPNHISLGIYHWKANDDVHTPPFGLGVCFDGPTGPISFVPEDLNQVPDLAARTSASPRIRRFLLEAGAQPIHAICEELDLETNTVQSALRRGQGQIFQRIDGGGQGAVA